MSDARSWFTYYFWLDDALAPDFARTVEIHRKAGYDPVELFLDPKLAFPKLYIVWKLVKKLLGFRMLLDVIPLDANLVKGSHGRPNEGDTGILQRSSEFCILGQKSISGMDCINSIF
jgi:hypothetical protein